MSGDSDDEKTKVASAREQLELLALKCEITQRVLRIVLMVIALFGMGMGLKFV